MKQQLNWILVHKEWIFSGIGTSIFMFIIAFFFTKKNNQITQSQKNGKQSINVQIGNISGGKK